MKINVDENKAYLEDGSELGEVVIFHVQSVKDRYDDKRKNVIALEIAIKDEAAYRKFVMYEPPEDKLQTRKVTVHDSSTEEDTENWIDRPGN